MLGPAFTGKLCSLQRLRKYNRRVSIWDLEVHPLWVIISFIQRFFYQWFHCSLLPILRIEYYCSWDSAISCVNQSLSASKTYVKQLNF